MSSFISDSREPSTSENQPTYLSLKGGLSTENSVSKSSVGESLSPYDVRNWTALQVQQWVLGKDTISQYADAFLSNNIDGNKLVNLTDEQMQRMLHITAANHRTTLHSYISSLTLSRKSRHRNRTEVKNKLKIKNQNQIQSPIQSPITTSLSVHRMDIKSPNREKRNKTMASKKYSANDAFKLANSKSLREVPTLDLDDDTDNEFEYDQEEDLLETEEEKKVEEKDNQNDDHDYEQEPGQEYEKSKDEGDDDKFARQEKDPQQRDAITKAMTFEEAKAAEIKNY
ncbi:hypothetical protein RFI_27763 [Reticulomyxa filosa]|uniref:SAM domain-containing protein n=1 Tax=Reticulomyxa filosa TaxID=46433 RepID=X6M6J4_RETFI|nr:hypothetical protein RFI_27763 [Reticulomyxa filosa]|eukprot:ETO09613.1 hypothetical protein RFI_27763 [Reticulomyxa filosa]